MAGPLNAKVILAKCSKSKKTFGIRIEERNGDWVRTWAFPIDERKAKREKFDANIITGSMNMDPEYPGCPYCGDQGFAQCNCGKINCVGGGQIYNDYMELTCSWCGVKSGYGAATRGFDVSGGGY